MKELMLFFAVTLSAQTPPVFEVASIKSNTSAGGGSSIQTAAGRITMQNVVLKKVTLWANGIPDDREYALAGPDWLTTERFDIQATFPASTSIEQVRQMTRTLLAERFKLTLHRETRQLPTYALVVGKNGPKIQAVENGQGRTAGRPGRLEAAGITMQKLADLLGRITGQQVTNETGLGGVFNFTLAWSPDERPGIIRPDGGAASGDSGPSMFTALQEQLGLKLEGRKGPVEILVVDHMERAPTEN